MQPPSAACEHRSPKRIVCLLWLNVALAAAACPASDTFDPDNFITTSSKPPGCDGNPANEPACASHELIEPKNISRPELFVFLPGAGLRPQDHDWVAQTAAHAGYRTIVLSYDTTRAVSEVCPGRLADPDCAANMRSALLRGGTVFRKNGAPLTVDKGGAVLPRLLRLLYEQEWGFQYYVRTPAGTSDYGAINFEKIVVGGFGDGASTAAHLAHKYTVHGVVMLEAVQDTFLRDGVNETSRELSAWLGKNGSATESCRFYAAYHREGWSAAHYTALGVPPQGAGGVFEIDDTTEDGNEAFAAGFFHLAVTSQQKPKSGSIEDSMGKDNVMSRWEVGGTRANRVDQAHVFSTYVAMLCRVSEVDPLCTKNVKEDNKGETELLAAHCKELYAEVALFDAFVIIVIIVTVLIIGASVIILFVAIKLRHKERAMPMSASNKVQPYDDIKHSEEKGMEMEEGREKDLKLKYRQSRKELKMMRKRLEETEQLFGKLKARYTALKAKDPVPAATVGADGAVTEEYKAVLSKRALEVIQSEVKRRVLKWREINQGLRERIQELEYTVAQISERIMAEDGEEGLKELIKMEKTIEMKTIKMRTEPMQQEEITVSVNASTLDVGLTQTQSPPSEPASAAQPVEPRGRPGSLPPQPKQSTAANEMLLDVYQYYDKNEDGKLTTRELLAGIGSTGLEMNLDKIDPNRDGYCSAEEWVAFFTEQVGVVPKPQVDRVKKWLMTRQSQRGEKILQKVFHVFDVNNDGSCVYKELEGAIREAGLKMDVYFKTMNKNPRDRVRINEWLHMFEPLPGDEVDNLRLWLSNNKTSSEL